MEKVNIDSCLFIYSNGSKVKALDIKSAKEHKEFLLKNGWNHTATIDPIRLIEYLANNDNDEDILITVKHLKNKLK